MQPRHKKLLFSAIAVLLLAWLGWIGYHGITLYRSALVLRAAADQNGADLDGPALLQTARIAGRSAEALQYALVPLYPICNLLGGVPGVGPVLGQVEPGMVFAGQAGGAAARVIEAMLPVMESDGQGEDMGSRMTTAAAENKSLLAEARVRINRAAEVRERLNPAVLPNDFRRLLDAVNANFSSMQAGLGLLSELGDLGGATHEQVYLVMAQNKDELRGSGGFISNFGLVRVQNGKVVSFEMVDSKDVTNPQTNYPAPPEPLANYMLVKQWLPKDANWSPDFPTAAQQVSELYAASTGIAVDGVIAFDQQALRDILDPLGAVQVEGVDEPVTSVNVILYMENAWTPRQDGEIATDFSDEHKSFTGKLGKAVLAKVLGLSNPLDLTRLGRELLRQMETGHVSMYLKNANAQQALADANLDSRIDPRQNDFLMVVDSNLGFNKADFSIERVLEYRVDLTDASAPRAELNLTYQSSAPVKSVCSHSTGEGLTYVELQNGCYWNYFRILTAPGTRLTRSDVKAVPAAWLIGGQGYPGGVGAAQAEGATTQWDGLLVVPAGERNQVGLQYDLPPGVVKQDAGGLTYHLRWQKQAGVTGWVGRVVIFAPQDLTLRSEFNWRRGETPGEWIWEGTLTQTLNFDLVFEKD
ncbi:MAG: DUF4012 domain-containing protein [Anaerolineae bacterium]|nr:DUF4012 domain-containing protein [Anaerolineae bacterium]